MNFAVRAGLVGAILGGPAAVWCCLVYTRSGYGTGAGDMIVQPVPFSHEHHAGRLRIDCRYCHDTVETSSFAGMPPTKTCMNCHSQMWAGSDMLALVRRSYAAGEPLRWRRVYNMPGFVYFDHSIHVHKGVGCSSCHGRVDLMPFTYQAPSLLMEWCLDCHRDPAAHLRPVEEVFNMEYQPPDNQRELGERLLTEHEILPTNQLTSCSVCHR